MMDLAKGKYDTSSQAHCGTFLFTQLLLQGRIDIALA